MWHHHHHKRFKSVLPVDTKIQFSRGCTCLRASDLPPRWRLCGNGTLRPDALPASPKPVDQLYHNQVAFNQSPIDGVPWEMNMLEWLPSTILTWHISLWHISLLFLLFSHLNIAPYLSFKKHKYDWEVFIVYTMSYRFRGKQFIHIASGFLHK
jgi:hypothetical protein